MACSKFDDYAELTECPICSCRYTDPKALPCLHSFCLRCLEQYVDSRQGTPHQTTRRLPCPVCQQGFVIPPAGCRGLQANFFLSRLMEVHAATAAPLCESNCESCGVRSSAAVSVNNYCVECHQKLCESCVKIHNQLSISKNHHVRTQTYADASQMEEVFKVRSSYCDQHAQELLSLYCKRCESPICWKCFALKHKDHDCEDIQEVADKGRKDIDEALKVASAQQIKEDKTTKEIFETRSAFIKHIEVKEDEVCRMSAEIKRITDARERRLLEELRNIKQTALKDFEQASEDGETNKTALHSFHQFADAVRSNGTHAEVARMSKDILDRAENFKMLTRSTVAVPEITVTTPTTTQIENSIVQLMPNFKIVNKTPRSQMPQCQSDSQHVNLCQSMSKKPVPDEVLSQHVPASPTRNVTNVQPQSASAQLVASKGVKMNITGVSVKSCAAQPVRVNLIKPISTKIGSIPGTEQVLGLTMLNNEIYISRQRKSEIHVLSGNNFIQIRVMPITGLRDPMDMTACKISNRVYISGCEEKIIFVMTPQQGLVMTWMTDRNPYGLSVTASANVIVAYGPDRKLQEFSSQGQVLRTVDLPAGMESSWHAVAYTPNTYIVCHGYGAFEAQHRVCEVDLQGNILRQFGGAPGTAQNQLHDPWRVALAPDGRVLVMECTNQRVSVLDSNLQSIDAIITNGAHGILSPTRMSLDTTSGRLLVAQANGQVLLFDVY